MAAMARTTNSAGVCADNVSKQDRFLMISESLNSGGRRDSFTCHIHKLKMEEKCYLMMIVHRY